MISNFKLYSAYYDLLYRDKDYQSESAYIDRHLQQLLPGARELLELGSGTGNHASYLSSYGYRITGVERSNEMIELAKRKSIPNFQPVLADITNFDLNLQFDAVISLFHSMCYLTTNDQLISAFNKAAKHLKTGGVFAFDFWYGPAVLHDLPTSRIKIQQDDFIEIIRKGDTVMYADKNIAEVTYNITVRNKSDNKCEIVNETHPMRYFSLPEIELIASQTGFTVNSFEEFLTGDKPTLQSWNILMILKKN